ncbi:MAG: hypothetical protein ACKVWV_17940 [Planctomycetota bacterium]
MIAFIACLLSTLAPVFTVPLREESQAPAIRALVERPLSVDGHAITTAEIERELARSVGRLLIDALVLEALADQELVWRARESLTKDGRPVDAKALLARRDEERARLWPSDAAVDTRVQHILAHHRTEFPRVPEEATVQARFRTRAWAHDIARRELYFDAVLLPDDTTSWSATTIAALDSAGGEGMADAVRAEIRRRAVDAATLGASRLPSDLPERDKRRALVEGELQSLLTVEQAEHALATDVLVRVDDGDGEPELELRTADVWPRVERALHETDIELARRWLAATRALRARCERDGLAVESSGSADAFARHVQELATAHRTVASAARDAGFTSPAAYAEAFCLQHAFRALVLQERARATARISPDGGSAAGLVERMRPRAVESAGRGMVNAEAILIPLYERPEFRWKRGGWDGVREEAAALQAEFDDNRARFQVGTLQVGTEREGVDPDALWLERLQQVSGFWDPPVALHTPERFGHPRNQGRFGRTYRDDLQQMLGETLQTQIALGTSLADHVFFEQKEDTIEGPVRGPLGYTFTRLVARLAAKNPLDLRVDANRKQVEDEALRLAFLHYAREALASAKIDGL